MMPPSAVIGKCWNGPAVCDGKLYVRSSSQAACYDLSIPDFKLECPRLLGGNGLELTVVGLDGSALPAERLKSLALIYTTNFDLPLPQWTHWPNAFDASGSVRLPPPSISSGGRFFRAVEPPPQP